MSKDTKRGYVHLPNILKWNKNNGFMDLVNEVEKTL